MIVPLWEISMRRKITGILILLALVSTISFSGDTRQYAVEEKETPKEQLALAATLAKEALMQQEASQRRDAINRAAVHYEVVLVKWPDDREAKVGALLGQADLFLNARRITDAADALTKLVPLTVGTLDEPQARAKLGQALFRTGRPSEAEKEFRAAEESARRQKNSSLELLSILAAAGFFSDTGSHAEAALRYRALAKSDSIGAIDRALYAVKAGEQQRRIATDRRFTEDIDLAKTLLAQARKENAPGRERQLDMIERYLERVTR